MDASDLPVLLEQVDEEALRIYLIAEVCRNSFWEFLKRFWSSVPGAGTLIPNWHMKILCDELQVAAERVFRMEPRQYDLVFNVPFGTSKSTICSILFPTWTWTRMLGMRHICATHTQSLVLDFSIKSRSVMESALYKACYPEVILTRDTGEVYSNTGGGEWRGCTVGGKTPTGFHAHHLAMDDPIDPQGARSEAELDTASHFAREVLPSRKVDKEVSFTTLVMQRLEYRDPTAVMLRIGKEEGATPVRHICLPGNDTFDIHPPEYKRFYTDYNEYSGCMPEGLMDPRRLSRTELRRYEITLGAYGYAGQVGQQPFPPGGGMFKDPYFSRRVRAAPYEAKRIRYWDRAATQDGGCATAGTLLAKNHEGHYYVEHVVWGQWEPTERNRMMRATALRDRAKYGPKYEPLIYVEHEPGSSGVDSYKEVARILAGFKVYPDRPTGSKDTRAEPWSAQCAAGNVYIVDNGESEGTGKADWDINAYVQEHCLFRPIPGKRLGKDKDRVDSSSGAYNLLTGSRPQASLRVLTTGPKKGMHKIVACSEEELGNLQVEEHRCIMVVFRDPLPLEMHSGALNGNGVPSSPLPFHLLDHLLDHLILTFPDLDPADYQDRWDRPVYPYGKLPPELIMTQSEGKKIWSLIKKQRSENWEILLFVDSGDNRAFSAALSVCDIMGFERSSTIHRPCDPDTLVSKEIKPPNGHVYDLIKSTRGMVMG
jgi:phage terminase large subunit-like protein